MPSAHATLAAGSGPGPRFPFQVSALLTTVDCLELHFPRGGSGNNEPFIVFPLMKSDRAHLSFPVEDQVGPFLLLFFSGTQAGACLSLCSAPSFCGAKKDRERADSGRSRWHRCFLSLGQSGCVFQNKLNAMARCVFGTFQALGGGRCF